MNHSAFAHLPAAFFALAPELQQFDWPQESKATCSDCAVSSPTGEGTRLRPFNEQTKCCTYHPTHPNWLVGRALRRDGVGAEQVRKRLLCMDDGVSVVGIGPSQHIKDEWLTFEDPWAMFGQKPEYLCPYFERETKGCQVWQDRGAICRTWFCKHEDGTRGYELWGAVRRVLKSVERRLAAWCIVHGDPPDEDQWGDREVMTAWFLRCADLVDQMTPDQAAGMRDELLEQRLARLDEKQKALFPDLPTYLGPSVGWFEREESGETLLACAQSGLDTVRLPVSIFQLLSRLDGRTPWTDAVASANQALGEPAFDEAILMRLFRMGLIEERDPRTPDPAPGVSMAGSRVLQDYDREDKLW